VPNPVDTVAFGKIARTEWAGTGDPNVGSVIIDSLKPAFTISGVDRYPVSGDTLQKMGWKTGWTKGVINQTCVSVNLSPSHSYSVWCLYRFNAEVQDGDSGGPVFRVTSYDQSFARLAGVTSADGTPGTYYSPMGSIERPDELGDLVVFNPGYNPLSVAIAGPTEVVQHQDEGCEWDANVSGGAGGNTYEWVIIGGDAVFVGGSTGASASLDIGSQDFSLGVTLIDADVNYDYDEIFVDVGVSHPECEG
jgi:hypothetical protein